MSRDSFEMEVIRIQAFRYLPYSAQCHVVLLLRNVYFVVKGKAQCKYKYYNINTPYISVQCLTYNLTL
jgi:hypothetical protein